MLEQTLQFPTNGDQALSSTLLCYSLFSSPFFFLYLCFAGCRNSAEIGWPRVSQVDVSDRWNHTRELEREAIPEMRSRSARRVLHRENLTQFSRVDAATKTGDERALESCSRSPLVKLRTVRISRVIFTQPCCFWQNIWT